MTPREWYQLGFLRGASFIAGMVLLFLALDMLTHRSRGFPVPVTLDPETVRKPDDAKAD